MVYLVYTTTNITIEFFSVQIKTMHAGEEWSPSDRIFFSDRKYT